MERPIDHLGFVVRDAKKTVEAFEKLFQVEGKVWVYDVEKINFGQVTVNGIRFCFAEPLTDDTRWAAYLRERGEGLEHICFANFDVDNMMAKADSLGMKMLYKPFKDVGGRRANIVSQDALYATQIEFIEPPTSESSEVR